MKMRPWLAHWHTGELRLPSYYDTHIESIYTEHARRFELSSLDFIHDRDRTSPDRPMTLITHIYIFIDNRSKVSY